MASSKLVWQSMFHFKLCISNKEAGHYAERGGILSFAARQAVGIRKASVSRACFIPANAAAVNLVKAAGGCDVRDGGTTAEPPRIAWQRIGEQRGPLAVLLTWLSNSCWAFKSGSWQWIPRDNWELSLRIFWFLQGWLVFLSLKYL